MDRLSHSDVVAYLLKKQWLSSETVLQDQLQIVNLSRRNCNFKVVSTQSPGYFLKQGNGELGLGTVSHEAYIYEFLAQQFTAGVLKYVPRCFGYETEREILTLAFIQNAEDLRTYQVKQGRFPKYLAIQMGKALAELHTLSSGSLGVRQAFNRNIFPDCTPWVLNAHQPHLSVLRTTSEANLKLMRMIQKFPAFGQHFDALSQSWQRTTLIHGDVKFENFIIYGMTKPSTPRKQGQIKLVDWEFAGLGDPCWDIGSVFSTYLKLWIFSIPITGEVPPKEFAKLAGFPLEKMHGAIAAFWQTYCKQMALDPKTAHEYLIKSIQLGAARLVQTALEVTDVGRLTSTVVCLMQLSLNILQRPEQAATHLFGISLETLS